MTNSLDPLVYIGINSFCVLSTLSIAAPCLSDKALLYTLVPHFSVGFAFLTVSFSSSGCPWTHGSAYCLSLSNSVNYHAWYPSFLFCSALSCSVFAWFCSVTRSHESQAYLKLKIWEWLWTPDLIASITGANTRIQVCTSMPSFLQFFRYLVSFCSLNIFHIASKYLSNDTAIWDSLWYLLVTFIMSINHTLFFWRSHNFSKMRTF